jgi:hypothetical protein
MVPNKIARKELFSFLDRPRNASKEQIRDTIVMSVEFMKYQAEISYEVSKKLAISITSTASTIGVGWSAFFFGISQESWITSSLGLMMVFAGTFLLGFWTPRILDKARTGLDELGAAKFYDRWLSSASTAEAVDGSQ